MRNVFLSALALFASSAVPAQMRAVELAIETQAGAIVLPSNPPSSVTVTPCRGCKPTLVRTSEKSRYFINREAVSLDELRRQLRSRPDASVVLLYDRKTGELRRLLADIY